MARSASLIFNIAVLALIVYVIQSQFTAFVNSSTSHGSNRQLRSRVRLGPFKLQIAEAQRALEILRENQAKMEKGEAVTFSPSEPVVDKKRIEEAKGNADMLTWAAKTCAEKGMPQAAAMQAKADAAVAAYEALKQGSHAPAATGSPAPAATGSPAPAATAPPSIAKEPLTIEEQIREAENHASLLNWSAETAAKNGLPQAAAMRAEALAALNTLEELKARAGGDTYVPAAPAPVAASPAAAASPMYTSSEPAGSPVASASPKNAPVTAQDVVNVQTAWAGAIKRISQIYKENGDYVKAAADAAGELYAYGEHNVLFKPTKAASTQFRPTPESAMSYFVGANAVDRGHAEDHGFAINGGKGWSDVIHDNHQIELKGDVAVAMGNYYFSCATTGEISRVEYTFGYTRCEDGKVRIFLHHSSVPYKVAAPAQMAR